MSGRVAARLNGLRQPGLGILLSIFALVALGSVAQFGAGVRASAPAGPAAAANPVPPSIVGYVTVGSRPVGVGVDPLYNRIFVSHNGQGFGLMTIDGTSNQVTGSFGGLQSGQDLSVNRTNHRVYVGNDGQTFITVYDAANPSSFVQANVGAVAPFGSASYEAAARTYVMIHQSKQIVTIDANSYGIVSNSPQLPPNWDLGNPLLGAVDAAVNRLYVTKFNSPSSWGLESYDLSDPSNPRLVYLLQYPTFGNQEADALGVTFNPANHDIYISYNGPASSGTGISGFVRRFDQFGNPIAVFEIPNASVGNLIYIPETNRVHVIQKQDGFLYALDGGALTQVGPALPLGRTANSGPERGIAYNPNTGLVYVASLRSNEVTIVRDFTVTPPTATPTNTPRPTCRALPTSTPGGTVPPARIFEPIIRGGNCI